MAAKKTSSAQKTSSAKTKSRAKKTLPASAVPALPKIGSPATRALASIGVVRLDQLTRYTEAQLLELHGMGPKAMGILEEALAAKGKSFKKK